MTYTPPQEPVFRLDSMASPQRRQGRAGLVAAIAVGAVALMAITGSVVWYIAKPPHTATSSPAAVETLTATGSVVLKHSQFKWNGLADPTCQGWQGFDDITAGTQVTATDAAGKVLAIGTLDRGTATEITTADVNGLPRAELCTLPFTVAGLPKDAGPYGIEIAHRGVVRYDEGHLGVIRIGF